MAESEMTQWRRIAKRAVVFAVVVAAVGGYPLGRQAWFEYRAERVRARYATGLSPCDAHSLMMVERIDRALWSESPSTPDISITVFPSFSAPHGVRLAETSSRFFRRAPHVDSVAAEALDRVGKIDEADERSFALSSETVRAIRRTLIEDIEHAHAERELGLDGAIFVFQVRGGGCAETWSPRATTRAGTWASLAQTLFEMANRDADAGGQAEVQDLLEKLRE